MTGEVRFFLELLDEDAVAAAVDFPIDVPQVVAGSVLAVLGEFGGEAVIGAAMCSGDGSFDGAASAQRQPFQLAERSRIEIRQVLSHSRKLTRRGCEFFREA